MSGLLVHGWVRVLAIWGAVLMTALLFLIGLRRQGERMGELHAQLRQARAIERARARMEEVPRPHPGDLERRLRDGDF